jgi:tRNA G18 (ribose-2'-O)-methylase SpoU
MEAIRRALRVLPITDPDDPRIADYRDIRERDLVGRRGLFIAEGEVVLERLTRSLTCEPLSVLIDEKRLSKVAHILNQFPDLPFYAATQPVIDAIAGFHLHRGILALGRRKHIETAADLLARTPQTALVLALFGIANHDNMGGLFRNAAAFGADAVVIDSACCDPLYRKAIRVSVGAALQTPFARLEPGQDAVGLLHDAGFLSLALSPGGKARLSDVRAPGRTAVLLGAEGPGLPPDVLARAETVAIPMAGGFDSLNVATAAGIVLHQLRFPPGS